MIRSLTVLFLCLTLSISCFAQTIDGDAARQNDVRVAASLSQITTLSFSPLLVGGYRCAHTYYATPINRRSTLPWTSQPWFWLTLLSIGFLFTVNGLLGGLSGPLKKFIDASETVEGKITPLYGSAMVIPIGIEMLKNLELAGVSITPFSNANAASLIVDSASSGIATSIFGTILALAIFATVWLTNQAIHTIVLLSPFAIIGTTLRFFQLTFLGFFLLVAAFSPVLGACISIILIFISIRLTGWSFRLSIFGTIFAWDILRFSNKSPATTPVLAFSGSGLPLPVRTMGRLHRQSGRLELRYRPWIIGRARHLPIPGGTATLTHGLLYSQLHHISAAGDITLLALPPRYRGSEDELIRLIGCGSRPSMLKGGVNAVLAWVRATSKM